MNKEFSIKSYLIDANLVNKDGALICSNRLDNPPWGFGPFDQWETLIYLCTLVYFFNQNCELGNIIFSVSNINKTQYYIDVDQIVSDLYSVNCIINAADVLDFIIPKMTDNNKSQLASRLFYNN